MDTLLTYIKLGLDHILDTNGYDHILFIISLSVLFTFKEWKTLLILVTAFTLGHSVTLALTVLDIISFKGVRIEALIILSIAFTSLLNVLRSGKSPSNNGLKLYYLMALFFGFIHGMGFANYLKAIMGSSNILTPLLGFNLGLEFGQIVIVLIVLIISILLDAFLRVKKDNFVVVISSMIFGITIPMLLEFDWGSF